MEKVDLGFPEVPLDRVAQTPLPRRDQARLMVLNRTSGELNHKIFSDLTDDVPAGDVLVVNDVRVVPARLSGRKPTGGRVSVLLLARYPGPGHERWTALVTPRPRPGTKVVFFGSTGASASLPGPLTAEIHTPLPDGEWEVRFDRVVPDLLERFGRLPLPPYIKRPSGTLPEDNEAYQTVYATSPPLASLASSSREVDPCEGGSDREGPLPRSRGRVARRAGRGRSSLKDFSPTSPAPLGAVAAPTAGLHFTPALLDAMRANGVRIVSLTLWVGWGTFRPISGGDYRRHRMLPELFRIPIETADAVNDARAAGKKVWAVGTTATRALESASDDQGRIAPGVGTASIYITPGYGFKVVDRLITNFHMPGHTPLLLAAAFAGVAPLRDAYRTALEKGYRFFSYGDAMVIL